MSTYVEHNDFIELSTEQQELVSAEQAWHYSIVPKAMLDHKLALFISDQVDGDELLDELEILFGCEVELEAIQDEIIKKTLSKYYRGKKKSTRKVKAIDGKNAEDFLDQLIVEANELGSSDIHIETFDSRCRVRIRIDGMLVERYTIKKDDYPALINKIKIKSNLDISEKRLPQDGRIIFKSAQDKFDIRVSVLPTLHGEKVVLRLLSNDATEIDIKELGFGEEELRNYMEGVKKPHGILLISGPTGSGKTTTLYATLKLLNDEKTNIMTVEDPIEYTLEGINQVQLKESIGLNFASALRTFLRQDPDVIMVGEIRDGETAQIAVRAALTGHLVLSTIHTNSAWGTVSRLADMGLPSYLIAGTLNTTVAQRLLRKLCPHCKRKESFDEQFFPINYTAPRKITDHYVPVGCEHCHFTGYAGRKAIYEVIPIDNELSDLIKNNEFNVDEQLQKKKIKKLSDQAFQIFEKGETSIEEVYSILLNA